MEGKLMKGKASGENQTSEINKSGLPSKEIQTGGINKSGLHSISFPCFVNAQQSLINLFTFYQRVETR